MALSAAFRVLKSILVAALDTLFKVIVEPALFKVLAVIVTAEIAPTCEIAPLAIAVKLPVKLTAGRAIAAASKIKVKLRKPVGKVGITAVALALRIAKSLTLPLLVITGVAPKLLAKLPNKISERAVVVVKVATPVTLIAADCVIDPAAVNKAVPVELILPKIKD